MKLLDSSIKLAFEFALEATSISLLRKYAFRVFVTMTVILSSSTWLLAVDTAMKNSIANVISAALACRLCFIIEYWKELKNSFLKSSLSVMLWRSEKWFSNLRSAFRNNDLSVVQFSDQARNKSDVPEISRVLSISELDVIADLSWHSMILVSFVLIVDLTNEMYWWSLSMNRMSSNVKSTNFSFAVRMSDVRKTNKCIEKWLHNEQKDNQVNKHY